MPEPPPQAEFTREQFTKLQDRVQELEMRLGALNDKINLENGPQTVAVEAPPAHGKVLPIKKPDQSAKPQTVEPILPSDSVDRFREAKILFDTHRYSDSIVEFSDFAKNQPDHPLTPAAQYYVGMSYFKQKEYKLAEEEFNRGLISYPHSNYTPDTLSALSQVSKFLKKPEKVMYYRQKLLSNFPHSPVARLIQNPAFPETLPIAAPAMAPPAEMKTSEDGKEPSVITKPEVPTVSIPKLEEESP